MGVCGTMKSLKRLTCEQLCIEHGLAQPTDKILQYADKVVATRNQPETSGAKLYDFSYDIECYPNFFRALLNLLIPDNVGYSKSVSGKMKVFNYCNS